MESSSRVAAHTQLEPWRDLEGKVVMVTGASSGLGRDFCLDLAKAGCRVIAAARRIDRLKSLCDEINNGLQISSDCDSALALSRAVGIRAVAVELDVSADGQAIEASIQRAWDAFGRIDALVNNAGVRGRVHTPLDLKEEEWDDLFQTNLKGTWLVSKYVCMRMQTAEIGGSVINVSSIAALNRGQLPGGLAYVASKTGVNAMAKIMAVEMGLYKIRVNAIAPGLFKSEITQALMQRDWLNDVARRTVPLRSFGTADPALTSLVRYLIHDSSEYVSGNIFIVDAGATLPGVPIFSSL